MRRPSVLLLCGLALAGCGYRAPLHPSYIPEVTDSILYGGVRPGYQQLAALMEKDTRLKPREGNTVTLIADGRDFIFVSPDACTVPDYFVVLYKRIDYEGFCISRSH